MLHEDRRTADPSRGVVCSADAPSVPALTRRTSSPRSSARRRTDRARADRADHPADVRIGDIGLRVLSGAEERRRRRLRTRYAIAVDLDARLARLGYGATFAEAISN
jgi:hypothetical protein